MDVVTILLVQGNRNGGELDDGFISIACLGPCPLTPAFGFLTHIPEKRKHFIVRSVIGNEEAQVGLVQDRSNSNETRAATWHNGDVLPGVLAVLALTVVLVVHLRDCLTERLDTGSWRIFSRVDGEVDVGRALEATFDIVFDLFPGGYQLVYPALVL